MTKPLTDAINALTTYANTVTGASDTTLSEAVATLANGYGGGGNDYLEQYLTNTLQTYSNDAVTSLGESALLGCSSLKSLSLPNCTVIFKTALANCTGLVSVKLPKCNEIGQAAMQAVALTELVVPQMLHLNTSCLNASRSLAAVDIGNSTITSGNVYVAASAFLNDSALTTLVIRHSLCITLVNINAFNGTPFASGGTGGTLYVPSALISSYQSATNWSTILGYANNQILPIEGSIYETQYADGTPIE